MGRLRSVVVGRADNALVPSDDLRLRAINYAGGRKHAIPHGPYPGHVIEEANGALEIVCWVFTDAGVSVYHPLVARTQARHGATCWQTDGYYALCPRDGLLVVGNTVIESPMVLRARYTDAYSYRHILQEAVLDGARWIAAPKPQLLDESCYESADREYKSLRNIEPMFDAANVLRANEGLLFLERNSGNTLGAHGCSAPWGRTTAHTCCSAFTATCISTAR